MNEFETVVSDATLDRLVDGEMSLAEQRALLVRLDQNPNGWRRAALAFLEAQALRQVCPGFISDGRYCAEPKKPFATALALKAPASAVNRHIREFVIGTAAAAVAFLLGMWTTHPEAARPDSQTVAATSPPATIPPRVDRLQVVFPEGAGQWSDPVNLPVVDGADRRAQVWLNEGTVWPASLHEALRAAGRHVTEERQWMPVDLEDGRQGYVPVSELVVSADVPLEYP